MPPPGIGVGSEVFSAALARGASAKSDATAKPAAAVAVVKNPRRVKFLPFE